jgi:hypothetical protein
LEVNGTVAPMKASPRINNQNNKSIDHEPPSLANGNNWWYMEKRAIDQFKSAYTVSKEQQIQDVYMSPQPKKHGGKKKNRFQPASATIAKLSSKASMDDLNQPIPII